MSPLVCVYTIPLEPILSKIPEKIQSLRSAAVPQNGTASQGGGASLAARGQKISSPQPLHFLPARN